LADLILVLALEERELSAKAIPVEAMHGQVAKQAAAG
jgi:hypothetical protein